MQVIWIRPSNNGCALIVAPNRSRAGGDPCGILGDPCGILGHPCGILGDPLGMDLGLPKRAGRPPPHMVQLDEVVAGPIFQMRCKVAFTLALMSCPVRCCCYCYCY